MEVAGLALGAISLGIEVSKALITFVDAIKSHSEDLDALGLQARALERNFDVIRTVLSRLEEPRSSNITRISKEGHVAIAQSVQACMPDLNALKVFIDKYSSGETASDPTLATFCRENYRKLIYGFKGEKRAELERRLIACNTALGVAMQAQGLNLLLSQSESSSRGMTQLAAELQGLKLETRQALAAITSSLVSTHSENQATMTTIVQRPASRPGLLRDVLDDNDVYQLSRGPHTEPLDQNQFISSRQCYCHQERKSNFWNTSFGFLAFSGETVPGVVHHSQCPLARRRFASKKSRTTFSTQVRLLGVALDMAFIVSTASRGGAGGWSIGTTIAHRTLVDETTAPGFQHLKILARMIRSEGLDSLGQEKSAGLKIKLLRHGLWHVRKALDSGKITPHAVNIHGDSLAQGVFMLIHNTVSCSGQASCMDLVRSIGTELIREYGVPIRAEVGVKYTARIASQWVKAAFHELQRMLPTDYEQLLDCNPVIFGCDSASDVLRDDPTLTKLFDLRPLDSAIINDEGDVVFLIVKADPRIVLSQSDFGFPTYLHLAIRMGRCFIEIVEALKSAKDDGQAILNELRQEYFEKFHTWRSGVRFTLLSCATSLPDRTIKQACRWATILAQLLEMGSRMAPDCNNPADACLSCTYVYIQDLVRRREELKAWARSVLSPADVVRLQLDTSRMLDEHTTEVIHLLEHNCYDVPVRLRVGCGLGRTVYHRVYGSLLPTTADQFKQAGFGHVDHVDEYGLSPVLMYLGTDRFSERAWSMTGWFIEQGACLLRPIGRLARSLAWSPPLGAHDHIGSAATVAHLVCSRLALMRYLWDKQCPDWVRTTGLLVWETSDDNCCSCVPSGWNPFMYFLASLLARPSANFRKGTDGPGIAITASRLRRVLPALEPVIGEKEYGTMLRYITFEALSMEHSSNEHGVIENTTDDGFAELNDEDTWAAFERILSDVGTVITQTMPSRCGKDLEELVQEECEPPTTTDGPRTRISQAESYECDRRDDGEKVQSHWTERWLTYWEDRVNEELDKLYEKDVAAGKVEAAQQLGVMWYSCDPPPGRAHARRRFVRDYDFWIKQLDSV